MIYNKNIILPDYKHCILNTITSILKYYNVKTNHNSLTNLDTILNKTKYKNIILLILDGLGEHILNNVSPNGFLKNNQIDCLTSVYPSTTTAALTSYYSGCSPIETGWIAWSQYFKEYGRALDMFSHNESYLREPLKNPSINVFDTIMKYKTIYEKITETSPDTKTYEIQPSYAETRCKYSIDADNMDLLLDNIKDLCSLPNNKFIFAYSDNPDKLLHKYGVSSNETSDFIKNTEQKIEKLSHILNKDSILIVSADHGHKNIEKSYTLLNYPELLECLIMPPTLESRILTFWVKKEMEIEFVNRFNNIFKKEFWLMTKEDFLEKYHFLGYGNKHPKIDDFIGNYMALSISSSMIRLETFLAEGKPIKKSTHCGLTKEEMEVPLIIISK